MSDLIQARPFSGRVGKPIKIRTCSQLPICTVMGQDKSGVEEFPVWFGVSHL